MLGLTLVNLTGRDGRGTATLAKFQHCHTLCVVATLGALRLTLGLVVSAHGMSLTYSLVVVYSLAPLLALGTLGVALVQLATLATGVGAAVSVVGAAARNGLAEHLRHV